LPKYGQADQLATALSKLANGREERTTVLFTAHSIPQSMASTCDYVTQLQEACRLTAEKCGGVEWRLVYQSRSGAPTQPWLEPDVCDAIRELASKGDSPNVVLSPIGFLSDHIEVLFDLDTEARAVCDELGLTMIRAATVGTHPRFVHTICELVQERLDAAAPRLAIGRYGPRADRCPEDCCPLPGRPRP
jgi:ferrochelatase